MSCAPVFIVGLPRSGTKLLRDLLNQHPVVAIPEAETEFLPWLDAWVAAHGEPADPRRFQSLWTSLRVQQYFQYRAESGRPIDPLAWRMGCRGFDTAGLFEALVRVDTGTLGADVVWGDKSPSYVDDITLIGRLFPNARVLHIVRDVRDHCASMRLAWGKHVLRAAQSWVDGVHSASMDGAALGARYHEVRYEDLLADAGSTLRSICDFLGLDFRPEMLRLQRASENLGRARGVTRVERSNVGRYREVLSAREVRAIEAIAGPTLAKLGYLVSQPGIGPRRLSRLRLALYRAHDVLRLLQFERRQRGWAGAAMFHWRRYRAVHQSHMA